MQCVVCIWQFHRCASCKIFRNIAKCSALFWSSIKTFLIKYYCWCVHVFRLICVFFFYVIMTRLFSRDWNVRFIVLCFWVIFMTLYYYSNEFIITLMVLWWISSLFEGLLFGCVQCMWCDWTTCHEQFFYVLAVHSVHIFLFVHKFCQQWITDQQRDFFIFF